MFARILYLTLALLLTAVEACAQPATVIGPVTPGNVPQFNSTTVLKDSGIPASSIGGGGRTRPSSPVALYVACDASGNDSNNGTSTATPWATLQHAWNTIVANYDLGLTAVTVNWQSTCATSSGNLLSAYPGDFPNSTFYPVTFQAGIFNGSGTAPVMQANGTGGNAGEVIHAAFGARANFQGSFSFHSAGSDGVRSVSTASIGFGSGAGVSSIASGTYNSGTGIVVLTLSQSVNVNIGSGVVLSGLTGTGAFASLNAGFPATIATSGTTVTVQGPTGLGVTTITGGTATAWTDNITCAGVAGACFRPGEQRGVVGWNATMHVTLGGGSIIDAEDGIFDGITVISIDASNLTFSDACFASGAHGTLYASAGPASSTFIGTGVGSLICTKWKTRDHGAIFGAGVPGSGVAPDSYFPGNVAGVASTGGLIETSGTRPMLGVGFSTAFTEQSGGDGGTFGNGTFGDQSALLGFTGLALGNCTIPGGGLRLCTNNPNLAGSGTASLGAQTVAGYVFAGQGSTDDFQAQNKNLQVVFHNPTGTQNTAFNGPIIPSGGGGSSGQFLQTNGTGGTTFASSKSMLACGMSTSVAGFQNTSNNYIQCNGVTGAGGLPGAIVPYAGTIRNMYVQALVAQPGAGQSYVFTAFINSVSTGVTCTMSGAGQSTCNDTTHTAAVAAGQGLAVQVNASAAAATTNQFNFQIEIDTP